MTASFPDHESPDPPPVIVEIKIPLSLHGQAETLRWNIERALRAFEELQPQLGDAILYALVDKRQGLAYLLETHLAALEQAVTGVAP
jgi:hypothetical protein